MSKSVNLRSFLLSGILVLVTLPSLADVRLPKIFGDGMVLQRDKPIVIWGWAEKGEKVTVSLGDKMAETVASKNGKWAVSLAAMKAGGSFSLTVKGNNEIQLNDILIGDVWVCSGQSNMQWTIGQTNYVEKDEALINSAKIRLFTVQIGADYLPKEDVDGGQWKSLSAEAIQQFSAVGYHFGKSLNVELDVPIGLINSSLGATYIEAWMDNETLATFDQFKPEVNPIISANKNFDQVNADFAKQKDQWFKKHYWKGRGLDEAWFDPSTDVSDWKDIKLGSFWETQGEDLLDHDGAVWYRTKFDLPDGYQDENFTIQLNQMDDYDATWVNGEKVGETYGRHNFRNYTFKTSVLKPKGNVLIVRVFDAEGYGGFTTSPFWGNPVLWGEWKYRKGVSIDSKKFKRPTTVNVSLFSSPGVLYNANIAPLTNLTIKGIIWYQGESNVHRAEEYGTLFPAMISSWRKKWGDSELPFLYVQLANHLPELAEPTDENWAELRDSQDKALALEKVGRAIAIDIGEAGDIHPKNKVDVGRRLAKAALNIAYEVDSVRITPQYQTHEIVGSMIYINTSDNLNTSDKYGYIRGFAVAGADKKFYWAKAWFEGDRIVVSSENVGSPVAVRYAWSSNPGSVDLYSDDGLPLAPFRTDDWDGVTKGKKFDHKAPRF